MTVPDPGANDPEAVVLDAFRRAMLAPHYREILAHAGVDPHQVRSMDAFRELVPILRKDDLFGADVPFHRICVDGELGPVRSIMVSSGFSGGNSFSVATEEECSHTVAAIDAAIDLLFGADQTPTLVINALAMGVHLPTGHALAETGPRSDSVLKVLSRFGPYFGQTVILADPHFVKKIVDEGNAAAVDWQARNVSFVAGGDWWPETLRTYVHRETGIADLGSRVMLGTMGLTELGLNIFFETRETIRLRRDACADGDLRAALFPYTGAAVPTLFHYDPARFHIEAIPHPDGRELVVTALSTTGRVPMIRYATGDLGDVLPQDALAATLSALGLSDLAPTLPLPCAWVAGRAAGIPTPTGPLRVEDLRHGIYGDHTVASAITGHFTIHDSGDGLRAAVQLRRGQEPSETLRWATRTALFSALDQDLPTDLYAHDDYPFGKDLNYEIKFRHSA